MSDSSTGSHAAPGLTVRDLACIRGGRVLFSGLGFDLAPGGLLLLTGPNGVGKSSLLRVLAGLLPQAAGTIGFGDGADRIAYLGHGDGLKPLATVTETLAFWNAMNSAHDSVARAQATERAMALFGLSPLADLPCRYLSAGQRRRVGLARVAASGAGLWLLDEPTTALDDEGVRAFDAALADHRGAGGLAVAATHLKLGGTDAAALALEDFAARDFAVPDPLASPGATDVAPHP